MKNNALDWLAESKTIRPTAKKSSRTQLQIVSLAEDTWLAPHLIPTDIYICPTEAMRTKGGAR